MSDVRVSGIMTLRNAEQVGYPYVPSILSVLPIVDEFLINDGGSDDGTWETLCTLADSFDKIELYQIPDGEPAAQWDMVDRQLNELIDEADGDWLIESQCDEVWPRSSLHTVNEIMRSDTEYASIRQPRLSNGEWDAVSNYDYWTVRCVKNAPDLESYEGGDSFHTGGYSSPTEGYTSHNVPPETKIDAPFWHIHDFDRVAHAERHLFWLATESDARRRLYERTVE